MGRDVARNVSTIVSCVLINGKLVKFIFAF